MSDYFARLANHFQELSKSLEDDLTGMLQIHAERSGWPLDAARSVFVEYEPAPSPAYAIKYYRPTGDLDAVRSYEYGFNGQEPNPVVRKMATRMAETADFLLAQRLSGGSS